MSVEHSNGETKSFQDHESGRHSLLMVFYSDCSEAYNLRLDVAILIDSKFFVMLIMLYCKLYTGWMLALVLTLSGWTLAKQSILH